MNTLALTTDAPESLHGASSPLLHARELRRLSLIVFLRLQRQRPRSFDLTQ
jgi:hypothetical protein